MCPADKLTFLYPGFLVVGTINPHVGTGIGGLYLERHLDRCILILFQRLLFSLDVSSCASDEGEVVEHFHIEDME